MARIVRCRLPAKLRDLIGSAQALEQDPTGKIVCAVTIRRASDRAGKDPDVFAVIRQSRRGPGGAGAES